MYKIQDEVYIVGAEGKNVITEISTQPTKSEYKLWTVWTKDYTWFDEFQITKDVPKRIWFKTD